MMYKPLHCFTLVAAIPTVIGLGIGVRFLAYYFAGRGNGHTQSLMLACTLLIIGFVTFVIGMLADVISANRKILEDVQYHVKKQEYDRESGQTEKKM